MPYRFLSGALSVANFIVKWPLQTCVLSVYTGHFSIDRPVTLYGAVLGVDSRASFDMHRWNRKQPIQWFCDTKSMRVNR